LIGHDALSVMEENVALASEVPPTLSFWQTGEAFLYAFAPIARESILERSLGWL
jgi:hypothetical protein